MYSSSVILGISFSSYSLCSMLVKSIVTFNENNSKFL